MDSAGGIVTCIQEASREMGLPVPSNERASHVIGLGLMDSLKFAVPELPPTGYARFAELYRKHFTARQGAMVLFPGVMDLLEGLCAAGYCLAVATGKSRRGLDHALAQTGVAKCITASRCADETNPKPHPAMLRELMAQLGRSHDELLMIGDTSHDLDMACSASVDAVAVTYGAHPEAQLKARSPKAVVGSIPELGEWLKAHA